MVTILPKEEGYSGIGESFGTGLVQGYQKRADEGAIKNALGKLGTNASARDVLDVLTNTQTYNNESKQNFLKNYLGVEEFDELKRKNIAQEQLERDKQKVDKLKDDLKKADEQKKAKKDVDDALTLIDSSQLDQENKDLLRDKAKNGEASFSSIKEVLKNQKEVKKITEEERVHKTAQKSYNEMARLIPEVGRSGIITSKLGGDTAKAYAQFTSLTGGLESILVEMVSSGRLSDTRFKYITEQLLPKPSDTQAEIEGKMLGLGTMLDLDTSALGGKQAQPEAKKDTKGRRSLSAFEMKE